MIFGGVSMYVIQSPALILHLWWASGLDALTLPTYHLHVSSGCGKIAMLFIPNCMSQPWTVQVMLMMFYSSVSKLCKAG